MADMKHFPNYSVVNGSVRMQLDMSRLAGQFERAQWWLGNQVLQDCKPFMPHRTGSMQQRSHTNSAGTEVFFPGPYARHQYMGKVMVDPETGSPWARPGARKVATDRSLIYSAPGATAKWFEAAKAAYGESWIAEVKRLAGGG